MDTEGANQTALIEAHKEAKKRARMLRIIFPLLIILIVVFNVYAMAQQVENLDTEALATETESRFHKLWPRLEEDLALVASDLEPVLKKELERQAAKLGPKLDRRLEKDVEVLKAQVDKDFRTELIRALEEIEQRQRNVLIEHIPELKNDKKGQDRVLEQVRVSLTKWCMKQLNTTLHEHVVALEQIRRTLQRGYVAAPGAKADAEEALSIWLELMNDAVGGDDTILAPPPPDKGKKPKKSNAKGQ